MKQFLPASMLVAIVLAGVISPPSAKAEPLTAATQQEYESMPAEIQAASRAIEEMRTVVFDVCEPLVRGSSLADTLGYEALGRPPVADGVFDTRSGIRVTLNEAAPRSCSFGFEQASRYAVFSFLDRLLAPHPPSLSNDWLGVPAKVGEQNVQMVSKDGRLGLTIYRSNDGGSVYAYETDPRSVVEHYAAIWAAEFNAPGDAAVLAMDACSSFMDTFERDRPDETALAEVAAYGRFGNNNATLRGNIDASIWDAPQGCTVAVADARLKSVVAASLAKTGSGWSQVTDTSWTHQDGSQVELRIADDGLHYDVRPGDFAQHDWPAERWESRDDEVSGESSDDYAATNASWVTVCRPGSDGFAVNCEAHKNDAGWLIGLSTGDDQVFLTVGAAACPSESALANWWREEVGVDRASLGSELTNAMPRLESEVRERCPAAATLGPDIEGFPVIMMLEAP